MQITCGRREGMQQTLLENLFLLSRIKTADHILNYGKPSIEDRSRSRMDHMIEGEISSICAEENGEILGYAYGSAFHPRAALAVCGNVHFCEHDGGAAVQGQDSIEPWSVFLQRGKF